MADISFFQPEQEAEIKRRRKYAELLGQNIKRADPNATAGGLVVPISPLQGLVEGLGVGMQTYNNTKADELESQRNTEMSKAYAQALGKLQTDPTAATQELMAVNPELGLKLYGDIQDRENKLELQRLKGQSAGGGFTVDPDTGEVSYSPTRKLSATEQKSYLENYGVTQATPLAIDQLEKAKGLIDKSGSGYFAPERAKLMSNINNFLGKPENPVDVATVDFDNTIQTQVLPQLKSIFGANPTEGERKILLDIQASSSDTPENKMAKINNAIQLANNRLAVSKKIVGGLATGNIYSANQQAPNVATPSSSVADQLRAKGLPESAIQQILKAKGIQ